MALLNNRPKKRLIVFLLACLTIIIYIFFGILYFVPSIGFQNLPSIAKYFFIAILAGIPLFLTFLILSLVISIVFEKDLFFTNKVRPLAIKILFPLVILIGNIFKIDLDKIRRSFIEINNALLKKFRKKFNKENTIILLPHCLQNFECKYKITNDIKNCKKCGKCKIKDILDITEKYGIFVAIATGGTMARKIVKEQRPEFIIAVACERDLASGIQDSYPLPVYGIINKRPFGPCFNTEIDLKEFDNVINYFLKI